MKIAIHQNKKVFDHSIKWERDWIKYCEENKIAYKIVDCYASNIIEEIIDCDCLLWNYQNNVLNDMLLARSILNTAECMGLRVFPNNNTSWHYDDKIAQSYLLQGIGATIPKSWIFSEEKAVRSWVDNSNEYPLVAKLKCGAGSHNVKLIRNKAEMNAYITKMFGNGIKGAPSVIFKAKSNIKSVKNIETFISRAKRIPEFVKTWRKANRFQREKDYCYFQEYIQNDGYDFKIVVIGNKASYIGRNIRDGDFRASGGGSLFYDKTKIPHNLIQSAFSTTDKLKLQCMGYDYVIDSTNKIGKIIEMSYAFSHRALLDAKGYWDRDLVWHAEPLDAPVEIIRNLLQ